MKDFFRLSLKYASSAIQAHPFNLKKNTEDIDEHTQLIRGDYEEIELPVIFHQAYGKKLQDILGTGWPSLFLISEKMKKLLEDNQLTGWKAFPIKLYDKKGNEIFGYHGFSILGRSDTNSYEESEIIEKRIVPEGPLSKYYKGTFVENWDESDFFIPERTLHIFITKKSADLLKENQITNLLLEHLNEYEIAESSVAPAKRKSS